MQQLCSMKAAHLVQGFDMLKARIRSNVRRSFAPPIATVLAMGGRDLLNTWLGASAAPFLFALPAVFIVGWRLGLLPACATVVLAAAWLLAPQVWHGGPAAANWRPVLYFLPSAFLLAFLAWRLRTRQQPALATPIVEQRRTVAWLWAAMLLAVVVPVAMFAAAGVSLYAQAFAEARTRVDRAVRVSEEHALKVFETNVALLNRVADLLGDDQDAVLHERERALHDQLKRMATNLPQLQGMFIIDSVGRMIATDRRFPAPVEIDYSDRPAFAHHRAGGAQPYISDVLTSRATGEPFFDMSLRRSRAGARFGGTFSVSMSPQYFAAFYREMTDYGDEVNIELRRTDGAVLAGWPVSPVPTDVPGNASLRTTDDAKTSLVAKRPVGAYPIVVSAWLDKSVVFGHWYDQMALLLALSFPTAVGLVYVGWVALQRTRNTLQLLEALREETLTRQRAEVALHQAQKLEAMGRLTGGVAHDFNNLLMIVSSSLHLHRRQLPDLAQSTHLTSIERAVAAGTKLTRQLLSFSRRQPLQAEVIRLQERLPGIVELVKSAVGSSVQIELEIESSVASIEVDPAEFELAVLNLAINAKDAMPDGGRIRICALNAPAPAGSANSGAHVEVSVHDSGHGIDPTLAQRVFEPFFTTKPVGRGTGLGLSQVHGLCKRAGGIASIDSRPGEGTTVRMCFPQAADQLHTRVAADDEERRVDLQPQRRILLVEDNNDVANSTLALLESMKCIVKHAVDADDALAQLSQPKVEIDLMLSDIVMPGSMDGIELACQVRARHADLPILLMSGYSERIQAAVAMRFDVLPKPCSPDALKAAIHTALSRGATD